jgi:succinate dehydrogenase / fumarate reductase cytochrome b subunit
MNGLIRFFSSSVGKKYLMAVTGTILALFLLGHMCGNLQFFLDAKWINSYAHHLQHLPYGLLWVIRAVLLATIIVHLVVGSALKLHNVKARPEYEVERTVQASFGSRTMIWTGIVIALFVVLHLMHYTVKNLQDFASIPEYNLEGVGFVPDVQMIMYSGFSVWYYSVFYIFAVGFILFHLTHGVASVFQSMGLRNEVWRGFLVKFAWCYGAAVFCGFAALPAAVLLDVFVCPGLLPLGV